MQEIKRPQYYEPAQRSSQKKAMEARRKMRRPHDEG